MVIRELTGGRSIVSTQEDHAELSAQFAAHWGNQRFSSLRPYSTMVFATTYHDSGYREWEGNPPMNVEKGRPYAHREDIPGFEPIELKSYAKNVEWIRSQDPYAALLVSMHRTGLWHNRYGVFVKPQGRLRERSAEIQAAKKAMEADQEEARKSLAAGNPRFEDELWFNYRALQVYDLLSLYFCCDGYATETDFKTYAIAPVRVSYDSDEEVELQIAPDGPGSVIITPYPFDVSPLRVSVRGRTVVAPKQKSEKACVEAYHKAARDLIAFEIAG